jgi:predicted small lipoprotein YifL
MLKRMTRFGLLAVLFAGLAFTQTACGKKGNLKPPSGQSSDYPRTYPTQ